MKYTYENNEYIGLNGQTFTTIIRSDGAFIPSDLANSDYQRYLRWLNGEEETGTLS